ncbi:MAG: MotA/TolQ/ExbB proton channel family protein [Myxococcota bacterium]
MTASEILELLQLGGLTVYPLGVCSMITVWIFFARLWQYRGMTKDTRALTGRVVEALVRRDLDVARSNCEKSKNPMAEVFLEGMRWRGVTLDELEQILSTSRQEVVAELRRGLWGLGTIGSLAPFVGLFGTVVGVMRAFREMAIQGVGGFEVVAAGISEALIATAAGLGVAIIALAFYNYLQVRVGNIAQGFARSSERYVQALLFVESASEARQDVEVPQRGDLQPA